MIYLPMLEALIYTDKLDFDAGYHTFIIIVEVIDQDATAVDFGLTYRRLLQTSTITEWTPETTLRDKPAGTCFS